LGTGKNTKAAPTRLLRLGGGSQSIDLRADPGAAPPLKEGSYRKGIGGEPLVRRKGREALISQKKVRTKKYPVVVFPTGLENSLRPKKKYSRPRKGQSRTGGGGKKRVPGIQPDGLKRERGEGISLR